MRVETRGFSLSGAENAGGGRHWFPIGQDTSASRPMRRRLARQALRGLWLAKTQAGKRAAIDYLAEKLEESSRGEREKETEREGGSNHAMGGGGGY
jgi:hypothetical protein